MFYGELGDSLWQTYGVNMSQLADHSSKSPATAAGATPATPAAGPVVDVAELGDVLMGRWAGIRR